MKFSVIVQSFIHDSKYIHVCTDSIIFCNKNYLKLKIILGKKTETRPYLNDKNTNVHLLFRSHHTILTVLKKNVSHVTLKHNYFGMHAGRTNPVRTSQPTKPHVTCSVF